LEESREEREGEERALRVSEGRIEPLMG